MVISSLGRISIFYQVMALLFLSTFSAQVFAANYQLEIAQPQPSLNTLNRFYKAYPGLEYNVRLAIIGGDFPYRYELTSAPAGMVIDKKGEISWANPVDQGVPYEVTASVTDAASMTKSVTWTITVTKNGFKFVDAINGKTVAQGGKGTHDAPWKTIKDWYEGNDKDAENRSSYSGEFLYWRGGTYVMDAALDVNGSVRLKGGNKPQVWLAYPGESPVIDMKAAHFTIWNGTHTYIDGIEFNINGNPRGMGFMTSSDADHVTYRKNKFHGITNGYDGGNNAHVFLTKVSSGQQGSYWSFQDNEFYDINRGYGVLGYSSERILIEDNVLYDIGGHPIGPKEGTPMWFIRGNHFYNNPDDSIGLQYSDTGGILSGDIEISYNLINGGGRIRLNSNQTVTGKPVYVFRNTIIAEIGVAKVTATNGVFRISDNVIINSRPEVDKIVKLNIDVPSRLIIEKNLVGSSADGIVDANGYFTLDFIKYVGIHGHQLGNRPSAPTGLMVGSL